MHRAHRVSRGRLLGRWGRSLSLRSPRPPDDQVVVVVVFVRGGVGVVVAVEAVVVFFEAVVRLVVVLCFGCISHGGEQKEETKFTTTNRKQKTENRRLNRPIQTPTVPTCDGSYLTPKKGVFGLQRRVWVSNKSRLFSFFSVRCIYDKSTDQRPETHQGEFQTRSSTKHRLPRGRLVHAAMEL